MSLKQNLCYSRSDYKIEALQTRCPFQRKYQCITVFRRKTKQNNNNKPVSHSSPKNPIRKNGNLLGVGVQAGCLTLQYQQKLAASVLPLVAQGGRYQLLNQPSPRRREHRDEIYLLVQIPSNNVKFPMGKSSENHL